MIKKITYVAKEVLSLIYERKILEFAGSLAFFWFLAIFPGLIFLLSILAYFDLSQAVLSQQVDQVVPGSIGSIFLESILSAIEAPSEGLLSLGGFLFLWSGSQGFSILITLTVNSYGQTIEERSFFKRRGLAILLTILFSISTVSIISLNLWWGRITYHLNFIFEPPFLLQVVLSSGGYFIFTVLLTLFISFFYKLAPEKNVRWRYVLPGSIFSIISWQLITILFSLYIIEINNFSMYGSLGGITISLVWLYFTGIILLIGTEINIVWADYRTKNTYHR